MYIYVCVCEWVSVVYVRVEYKQKINNTRIGIGTIGEKS